MHLQQLQEDSSETKSSVKFQAVTISHKITVMDGMTGHDGMTANENDQQHPECDAQSQGSGSDGQEDCLVCQSASSCCCRVS
jgi:hypothetical protein